MKVFSGVVLVEYADTVGGTYTELNGEIDAESTIELPPTTNNTTTGITYGGGTLNANLMFFDHTDYSTVAGFMDTNGSETKKAWRFTLEDGTVLTVQKLIAPIVERMVDPDAREGATPWSLQLEKYSNADLVVQS